MKKFIITIGLALVAGVTYATNWTNYPVGVPAHTDTFLFGTATTNQFGNPTNAQITADGLTYFANTNISTLAAFVANPLTNGVNFTSPPVRGFLTLNLIVTNNGTAWLTNKTTGFNEAIGSISSPAATNFDLLFMRTGPADVFMFTNFSGVGVVSSRWQP